jgi:hypothetical protein
MARLAPPRHRQKGTKNAENRRYDDAPRARTAEPFVGGTMGRAYPEAQMTSVADRAEPPGQDARQIDDPYPRKRHSASTSVMLPPICEAIVEGSP